ncbi:MAG: arginine biosynthesis protein ArgJ, partial [Clostridiales bacterium]|nr:arginine biosynthesis protein ArgJ [Clostridiales bacterium]
MNTEGLIITKDGLKGIRGYRYAGVSSGIRKNGREDLTLIFSEVPAVSAGVFTTNKSKAAPVLIDLQNIKNPVTRAVVIN